MAEGTGLENRHTGEPGIESSNLSLSVSPRRTRMRFLSAIALLVAGIAVAPVASAQRPALLGVYDAQTGAPIQGAVVRDTLGAQALTSADGVVALTYVNAIGPFVLLEIRKVGYRPLHVKVRADSLRDRTELLEPLPLGEANALPAVVTTAKYNVRLDSGLWNGFAARCTVETVRCFKFDELAERPSDALVDFLDRAGGMTPQCGTTMTRGARPRRVTGSGGRTLDCVKMRGTGVLAAKLCVPTYYLDGFARGNAENTLDQIEESLNPGDVKGIEVYMSGDPVPARWDGGGGNVGCGAVVIWTK